MRRRGRRVALSQFQSRLSGGVAGAALPADVLEELPGHPAKRVDEVLPWNWKARTLALGWRHVRDDARPWILAGPPAPVRALFKKADRGSRALIVRFSRSARNPCSAQKFPAHSLLDAKKFPARPRREFCRKTLKSKAVSAQMSAKRAEFPANSLPAGNFIDSIWIAGMTTIERLGS